MKRKARIASILSSVLLFVSLLQGAESYGVNIGAGTPKIGGQPDAVWYFAVSGDSRDCGDLIMPKIAEAVRKEKPPVAFYWHLGDYRRMFSVDCDILKRQFPFYDCKTRPLESFAQGSLSAYQKVAWDDFIEHQLKPFGDLPIFLAIGNHELIGKDREQYREKFRPWLAEQTIHEQADIDARRGLLSSEGDTYYHFVKNGMDFITLDNADEASFSPIQVAWLMKLLESDEKDQSVKGIVVGMHAALPFSTSANHAMDASCQGICSGQQVYDLLYRAQNIFQKHVYLLASHSHYFQKDIYQTKEHEGRVLPGWIVGTAGAEQYEQTIMYGYLLVAVHPDGTITAQFKEATRDSPPQASGQEAEELTDYCFTRNKIDPGEVPKNIAKHCICGVVK